MIGSRKAFDASGFTASATLMQGSAGEVNWSAVRSMSLRLIDVPSG